MLLKNNNNLIHITEANIIEMGKKLGKHLLNLKDAASAARHYGKIELINNRILNPYVSEINKTILMGMKNDEVTKMLKSIDKYKTRKFNMTTHNKATNSEVVDIDGVDLATDFTPDHITKGAMKAARLDGRYDPYHLNKILGAGVIGTTVNKRLHRKESKENDSPANK